MQRMTIFCCCCCSSALPYTTILSVDSGKCFAWTTSIYLFYWSLKWIAAGQVLSMFFSSVLFIFFFLFFHHSTILLKREIPKCQVVRGVAVAQVSSHKTKLLEQKISRTYDIIFVLALLHTQQVYRNSIKKSLIGRWLCWHQHQSMPSQFFVVVVFIHCHSCIQY